MKHSEVGVIRCMQLGHVLMVALLALLLFHVTGVCQDFIVSINAPFEWDYPEGIVLQQAALIPGPGMYGIWHGLPFIACNYPPLYYLLVHAARLLEPNLLAAGRLVSASATLLTAPVVAGLVLIATRRPDRPIAWIELGSAVIVGLLVLCLHAFRLWGAVMRVDTLAVALSMLGVLVAAWADSRFWGTVVALLLCVAAVFTKQTQLSAGIAVFVIALVRNPRGALGAAALAGGVGMAVLGLVQWLTAGGFLYNITAYNVNKFFFGQVYLVFMREATSLPFAILIFMAVPELFMKSLGHSLAGAITRFRREGRVSGARATLLLYFILASITLIGVFKAGSNFNYFLEWLCVGCVLIGVYLCDIVRAERGRRFLLIMAFLYLGVVLMPHRQFPGRFSPEVIERQQALVQRIAAAEKPVASENLTLLMQAGKPMIFEPEGTDLLALGAWDETPVIRLIRSHGFAFMITADNVQGGSHRRTPAFDQAMREAYPRVEQIDLPSKSSDGLWLHLPPG
ncbi:MAG: hypothetical protein P4M00_01070 [Azospirillaceae bacterium]|nr:hypothetical protein [Azospirillaceae bacterium]